MSGIWSLMARWLAREEGQDLAEYGLLVVLIAVVVVLGVSLLGQQILAFYQQIVARLPW